MTEKEKAAAGYLYNANHDPEILKDIMICGDLCHQYNQLRPTQFAEKGELLKRIIAKQGEDVCVFGPFWCDYGYNITIGNHFFANRNCQFLDGGKITFGDYVFIAPNCCFTTAEHALDVEQRNEGLEVALPIAIGNNVWIGAGVIVLGGVTIGDNTVIAAGSVVTKDIPSGVLAAGVPCRVLREITEADKEKYPRYKGE